MGLFDSLFGTNTTQATNGATNYANGLIQQNQAANDTILANSYGNANNALNAGATNATSALTSNYGTGAGYLQNYGQQAQGTLAGGVNSAVGTIQGSSANYQPYATSGTGANTALANALGLNGASGNAAATASFTGSPGYQYQVAQATDAAQRAAAAQGMGASGNTLAAITAAAGNLANQNYGSYMTNLSGLGSQGLTAAGGIQGADTAAGAAQLTGGTTGAALGQQVGTSLGTLYQGLGNQTGAVQTGLGQNLANEQTGYAGALVGNNNAAINAIAGNTLAEAKAQDSAANANNSITSNLFKNLGSAAFSGLGGFL